MENDILNTGPIERFIKLVKAADTSNQKEVKIPINEAKNIAFCLGIVLSRLSCKFDLFFNNKKDNNDTIQINIDGGNTW